MSVAPAPPPAPAPTRAEGREPCPDCGTPRTARFCERCRYDFVGRTSSAPGVRPALVAGTRLELVVTKDASDGGAPSAADQVPVFPLEGQEILVGRRSDLKDIHPEVPLNDDPGVSHRHAKLLHAADGSWVIVDLGSSNGTELNGALLGAGTRVRIGAGDELRLGVHTVIRIREH
jgi:hypothetical protein